MILRVARVTFPVGAAGAGALHIRKDASTPADGDVAAFALVPNVGRTLTVEAEFNVSSADGEAPPPGANVGIRAKAVGKGAAVLGDVKGATVAAQAPGNRIGPLTFDLDGAALFDKGVGKYEIAWSWELLLPGATAWTPFEQTQHTIYVTLDVPQVPWTQATASSAHLPWTSALDHACKWAKGVRIASGYARAVKSAARRIEAAIHDLGGSTVTYDGHATFVVGTGAGELDLAGFLAVLDGDAADIPATVNCTDCAVLVAAFANLIGGDVQLVRIDRTVGRLQLNDVMRIGQTEVFTGGFDYHDIAARGADEQTQVFDATLRPDWDVTESAERFELTEGRRRGAIQPSRSARAYLQRLLESTDAQFANLELPARMMPCLRPCAGSPRIDPVTARLHLTYSNLIESLARPSVGPLVPRPVTIPAIDVPGFVIYDRVDEPSSLSSLEGLVAVSADLGYLPIDPRERLRDVRQRVQDARLGEARATRFRLTLGWSPAIEAARSALAWVMTYFAEPLEPAAPHADQTIGDVAFVAEAERAIFFSRQNVVARVVALGPRPASVVPIAVAADDAIRRSLRRLSRGPDGDDRQA